MMLAKLLNPKYRTALHKSTAAHNTSSGGLAFVHAYHDNFWNASLHILSMPVYVHTLMVIPLIWLSPFELTVTRDLASGFVLLAYLSVDAVGAIAYAMLMYSTISIGIYFQLYESAYSILVTALAGAVEIMFTQVSIGHNLFQGYNATFALREAYVYTPFYFVLRFLRWFGHIGHEEAYATIPAPHETLIGNKGEIPRRSVSNWCMNTTVQVDKLVFPSTLQDLVDIVNEARVSGKRVRACGKRHTFNPISLCGDGDILMRTDFLQDFRIDATNRRAFVQTGVTVEMLDKALAEKKLCVPTNVLLKTVTWGGIVQTGSHGSGHVPLPEMIQAIVLVDGLGKIRHFHRNQDKEFQAVVQGLGSCGLVLEMELAVEPIQELQMITKLENFWPNEKYIRDLHMKSDQIEIFFIPDCSSVCRSWHCRAKKSKKVDLDWTNSLKYTIADIMAQLGGALVQMAYLVHLPGLAIFFLRLSKLCFASQLWDRVGPTHTMIHYLNRIDDFPALSMEFALPLGEIDAAVALFRSMLEEYNTGGKVHNVQLAELRITPPSQTLLFSGAKAGSKDIAWFELIGFRSATGFREFGEDFSHRMLCRFPSTFPHWAKDLTVIPPGVLHQRASDVFGSNLEEFNSIRKDLDPNGMFVNDFLASVLEGRRSG